MEHPMAVNRRAFIRIAGSSAVILAAGAGYFGATRRPDEALAPWGLAGTGYAEPRMRALSYAILAPNPHNRQPWIVDLAMPDQATLYCDLERLLPETDPFNRQITIGLGCFLEILRMAAAQEGLAAEIVGFPDGEPEPLLDSRPVARITFREAAAVSRDPLFAQVLSRRSNKEPYDTARPVANMHLENLVSVTDDTVHVQATNDPADLEKYRALTWAAHKIEMLTLRTLQESIDLMRIGKAEINANPDGIDLGGFMLEAMSLAGMLNQETLADPDSAAFQQGLDMFEKLLFSAMGFVWIITKTNRRSEQLIAGRNWVRLNLQATALGLSVHPLSQALQEYPEMAELFSGLHQDLGAKDQNRVQMFARLGHGPKTTETPRWKLETRMRNI
jgi:hypothetical protein